MTKNTIMIVDDDPEILALLGGVFRRRGYEVLAVEESTSVLDMLNESSPDLFLLDVMMPGLNGIELCQMIRALPQHAQTPVLIVSAYSDTSIVEQMFAAGANDYIFKPVEPRALEARVHDLLGITEA